MKLFIFICLWSFVCFNGVYSAPSNTKLNQANVDKYIDVLFQYVDKWIISNGLDPYKLQDIVKSFKVKPALITYSGELKLSNGHMQGLSKVKRGGNSEMRYEAMFLNIKLPILIEEAQIDFDYKATLMNLLTHSGGIDAQIKNLLLFLDVTIDTKTLEVILQDFHIVDSGTITLKFSGHPAIDWLANFLSEFITMILHEVVQNVIEGEVKGMIEQKIKEINDKRPPHGENANRLIETAHHNKQWYLDYLKRTEKPLEAIKFILPYEGHNNSPLIERCTSSLLLMSKEQIVD